MDKIITFLYLNKMFEQDSFTWTRCLNKIVLHDKMFEQDNLYLNKMFEQDNLYLIKIIYTWTRCLNKIIYTWVFMSTVLHTDVKDRMWRKNRAVYPENLCIGVDLNRNFDNNFGGPGSSNNSCIATYCGKDLFLTRFTRDYSHNSLNTWHIGFVRWMLNEYHWNLK